MRIPIKGEIEIQPTRTYTIVSPTYGMGNIPPQVVKFLKSTDLTLINAVVGSGNTNFGSTFALAAYKIAHRLSIPVLHCFELMGTEYDLEIVQNKLESLDGYAKLH